MYKHANDVHPIGADPLLPTGIGERCSQTISNLGHAALLRQCELTLNYPINDIAELTRWAL
jgi:hypothetical protein